LDCATRGVRDPPGRIAAADDGDEEDCKGAKSNYSAGRNWMATRMAQYSLSLLPARPWPRSGPDGDAARDSDEDEASAGGRTCRGGRPRDRAELGGRGR